MIPGPYISIEAKIALIQKCMQEGENDVRHLGRYLWYEYFCSTCGTKGVLFTPDYPYCMPAREWICDHCYKMMTICSYEPILGIPKKVTWRTND